ncbi:MAG: peptidoglycan-binding protein LysM [Bacteroidota bacterium]
MGIFDFIREAGKEKAVEDNVNANINTVLTKKLEEYGLEVSGVEVKLEDGVITVTGEAADQATREKVVMALGNLKGVSQVDDQMTLPEGAVVAAKEPVFHTVVRGDSLSKIAKQYYGNAMKYPVIFEANKPMLKDPNLIYPGQYLRIPDAEA